MISVLLSQAHTGRAARRFCVFKAGARHLVGAFMAAAGGRDGGHSPRGTRRDPTRPQDPKRPLHRSSLIMSHLIIRHIPIYSIIFHDIPSYFVISHLPSSLRASDTGPPWGKPSKGRRRRSACTAAGSPVAPQRCSPSPSWPCSNRRPPRCRRNSPSHPTSPAEAHTDVAFWCEALHI